MPYTASDVSSLPSNVQAMGADDRRQWIAIYNSAFARCKREGGDDCEGASFRQANGVLKKATASRNGNGKGLRQAIGDLRARFGGGSGEATVVTELATLPEPYYEYGDTVYREGLVFRAGDYPDKAYAMTPEEIRAAAAGFDAPVPVDLEHVPTVLDGKLGELCSVQASADGAELRGVVALPRWLDQAIGTSQRKISATWNRQTKQLEGLALVLNPRVADAALMAAFSAAIGSHADDQQDAGAEASASPQPTDGQREESSAASEQSTPKEGTHVSGLKDRFMTLFAQLPEEQFATLAGDMEAERRAETRRAADEPAPTSAPAPATMAQPTTENTSERRLREQLAASEADNRRIRAERIAEQAAMFADHYIKGEGRAFPAERDTIIQQYIQAATDDLLLPGSVTFSDGRPGSRVAIVKAMLDSRPSHQLTAEQLAPGIFAALVNRDTTAADASKSETGVSAEELQKLIGRTTLGQSVLDYAKRGGTATNANGTSH